jgi:hypothetical protein
MRFLFRLTFWLGVVVYYLPATEPDSVRQTKARIDNPPAMKPKPRPHHTPDRATWPAPQPGDCWESIGKWFIARSCERISNHGPIRSAPSWRGPSPKSE